jgi:CheY-like chemotaxis protein
MHDTLKSFGINTILKKPLKPNRLLEFMFPLDLNPTVEKSNNTKRTFQIDYRKFKVLIVEDDPTNRRLAQKMLEKYFPNCTINTANNGLEAIDIFKKEDSDLILMDIYMPVMNGYESAKQIRQASSEVRIIALTASIGDDDKYKCFEAGMDAYLMKPYTPDAFKELIEKYITSSAD